MSNPVVMKRWIWIGAAVAITLWTLLTWGAYGLISLAGIALQTGTGLLANFPEWQHWLTWIVGIAEQFGVIALVVIWCLGTLALVVGSFVVSKFLVARYGSFKLL